MRVAFLPMRMTTEWPRLSSGMLSAILMRLVCMKQQTEQRKKVQEVCIRQPITSRISKRSQYRLAVLTSHPIQYQAPLFRALASRPEIDLHVFFCCRWGIEHYHDPGFGVSFSWDTPLLLGYRSTFLHNLSPRS